MVHTVCPFDIEQQEGRIIRQGNSNSEVRIFRYITKSSFDLYSWQILEQKQKFIGQIMTSKSPVRSAEDIDEAALSYAEVKALVSGNPLIKEKMQLKAQIAGLESDVETAKAIPVQKDEKGRELTEITIVGKTFTQKKEAGLAIIAACAGLKAIDTGGEIGSYGGFKLSAAYDPFNSQFLLHIQGKVSRSVTISKDSPQTDVNRLEAAVADIPHNLAAAQQQLDTTLQQLENAMIEVQKPFPQEDELAEKLARLSELNRALDNGTEKSTRRTSDIMADVDSDRPRKPSIRNRLRAAQARSAQQKAPERTQHRKHDPSL